MRRISTGVQGRSVLGKYFSIDNVLSTLETNTDIRLEPSGSGKVVADADVRISSGNSLEIMSGSSSNSVNLVAPSAMSSDFEITLPSTDGSDGTVLSTDGAGNLSFVDVAVEVNNQVADTETYYPTMTKLTSGGLNSLSVSDAKLSFQPSTGTLTVTNFVESSSISLKENFTQLDNPVDKILKLQPKMYDRKDGSSFNEPGLIAEDVYDIIPDIVSTDIDGNPFGIKYTKLSVYLIECIKVLNEKINLLQERETWRN